MPDSVPTFDTPWRRMTTALFSAPTTAAFSVTTEIDVTEALSYLAARAPGVQVGLVHLVAVAVARTIADEAPQFNTYLRYGRVRAKRSLDVLLVAKVPGEEALTEIRLPEAHTQAARTLAEASRRAVKHLRTPEGRRARHSAYLLARIPWPLRRLVVRVMRWLSIDLGVALPKYQFAPESFGTIILSEVGRFARSGQQPLWWYSAVEGPLLPVAQGTGMLWLLGARDSVVVQDGRPVVRTVVPLSGTFDHRLVDGSHQALLFDGIARRLQDPAALDRPWPSSPSDASSLAV